MHQAATSARRKPVHKKRKVTPPEAVRYGNATERQLKAFQTKINDTTPEPTPDGWRWRVPCPRCHAEVVLALRRSRFIAPPELRAVCICEHTTHAKRPPDVPSGCGFKAMVPMNVPHDA